MAAKAREMDSRDTRSSSTIAASPPCPTMAFSSAAALAALRVVRTTKNPSFANFWAMAPPTPQRMPTGMSLSSIARPCASRVLRPSDCHFEVAPTTTATGLRAWFMRFSSQDRGKAAPSTTLLSGRRLAAKLLEYLGRVLGRVGHPGPVLADDAVGADPDGGTDDALRFLAVHHLVAVRAPCRHDLAVGIGQERERELVLRRELLVRGGAIRGDAEHDDPGLLQLLPGIAEAARFLGAAGRVVLRVEVDNHVLALEVTGRHALAAGVLQGEIGRLLTLDDPGGHAITSRRSGPSGARYWGWRSVDARECTPSAMARANPASYPAGGRGTT